MASMSSNKNKKQLQYAEKKNHHNNEQDHNELSE